MNAIVIKETPVMRVFLFFSYLLLVQFYYQYYVNKKGIPLSKDSIIHQGGIKNPEPAVKYYYQYEYYIEILINSQVLSNCTKKENTFHCVSTCESIWFKIGNTTSAKEYVTDCDPIFYKKYSDIM